MKTSVCLGFILLFALPLHAETYSWVDDSGTYNFTEDYSAVPKKYRKKVKRREDLQQDVTPQGATVPGSLPGRAEKAEAKGTAAPGNEKDLFGGKSRAAWRKEMDVLEAELSSIARHIEAVKRQITDSQRVSKDKLEALKKEYSDSRANYDQKYKSYVELVETIRKAGIEVNIKK